MAPTIDSNTDEFNMSDETNTKQLECVASIVTCPLEQSAPAVKAKWKQLRRRRCRDGHAPKQVNGLKTQFSDLMRDFRGFSFPHPLSPTIVDIGCGEGEWVMQFAQQNPSFNVVGMEIRREAFADCAAHAPSNVAFVCANILAGDLHQLLRAIPGPLVLVCLQYPDPNMRTAKHRKRRMASPSFFLNISSFLHHDGLLFCRTDVAAVLVDVCQHASVLFDTVEDTELVQKARHIPTEREVMVKRKGGDSGKTKGEVYAQSFKLKEAVICKRRVHTECLMNHQSNNVFK
jgi:tRNA (guanine-N7-)-methyltransferase